MKNLRKAICMFIALNLCGHDEIYSQCNRCPPDPTTVPEPIVTTYKDNFARNFRTTKLKKKTHSISVDFSRESILDFYKYNFLNVPGKFYGINIDIICSGTLAFPGKLHSKQIGLMINAADIDCKSDPNAFVIINNSFNQSKQSYTPTPITIICGSNEQLQYRENYKEAHIETSANPDRYTKSVHFDKIILDLFYQDLVNNVNHKGIRFDFGSYNQPGKACGQKDDYQFNLFVSPVNSDGSADYQAFYQFIKGAFVPKEKEEEIRILSTLNHGTLCPSECPIDGK
jgi:hypothetical protein